MLLFNEKVIEESQEMLREAQAHIRRTIHLEGNDSFYENCNAATELCDKAVTNLVAQHAKEHNRFTEKECASILASMNYATLGEKVYSEIILSRLTLKRFNDAMVEDARSPSAIRQCAAEYVASCARVFHLMTSDKDDTFANIGIV